MNSSPTSWMSRRLMGRTILILPYFPKRHWNRRISFIPYSIPVRPEDCPWGAPHYYIATERCTPAPAIFLYRLFEMFRSVMRFSLRSKLRGVKFPIRKSLRARTSNKSLVAMRLARLTFEESLVFDIHRRMPQLRRSAHEVSLATPLHITHMLQSQSI